MIKKIYKIGGLTLIEITTYEDEREMPVKVKGGGEVIELTQKDIDKIEKSNEI